MSIFSVFYDKETAAQVAALRDAIKALSIKQEKMMIDITRILAEVARERTELDSWKALSTAQNKVISDLAAALKKAIEDNDPAAMAKVQADLDAAAAALASDNDEAEAAIRANTGVVEPHPSGPFAAS